MKVVQLPGQKLNDIPRMFRDTADEIEKGEYGDLRLAAVVLVEKGDAPRVSVFHFGGGSPVELLGALQAAHHQVLE